MSFAPDGSLWFLTGTKLVETRPDGVPTGVEITDAGIPSALAFAPDSTLLVCDSGPRKQVRLYDVKGVRWTAPLLPDDAKLSPKAICQQETTSSPPPVSRLPDSGALSTFTVRPMENWWAASVAEKNTPSGPAGSI